VSTLLGSSSPRFSSLPIGARIEVSATSFRIAHKLGTLISQGAGGSALIVDYGTDHAVGNSFRVRVYSIVIPILSQGRLTRVYRPLRVMHSRIRLTALARQTSLQTSTLHTFPRRWQEPVGPAPLPKTQVTFDLLKYRSNDARPALAAFFPITYGNRYARRRSAADGFFSRARGCTRESRSAACRWCWDG